MEACAWNFGPDKCEAKAPTEYFDGFSGACAAKSASLLANKTVVGNVTKEFVFTMAQRTDSEAAPDARGVECARFCFMTHNHKMVTYAQVVKDPGSKAPPTFICECHSHLCETDNDRKFERGYLNRCVARASLPHSPTVSDITIRRPYAIMLPYSEDGDRITRETSHKDALRGVHPRDTYAMNTPNPSFQTRFELLWPQLGEINSVVTGFPGSGYQPFGQREKFETSFASSYCSASKSIKDDGTVSTCGEYYASQPGDISMRKNPQTPCIPGVNCTLWDCYMFFEYAKQKQPSCTRMKQMYSESSCCSDPSKDAVSRVSPCLAGTLWNEHKQGCEPEPLIDLLKRYRYPNDKWVFIKTESTDSDYPALSTTDELEGLKNQTDRSWPQTLAGLP